MSAETANAVHLVILAAGLAAWVVGLLFHRATFHRPDPMRPELLRAGEEDVDADPAEVRDRVVAALRSGSGGGPGSFTIDEASDRRIAGHATVFHRKGGGGSARFEIDLAEGPRRTRAAWRILGTAAVGGLEWGGRIFVYFLTPLALILAAYLVQTFALPSDDPEIRAAAIQTVQVVHFLWPPFLFGGLRRRMIGTVSTMLGNTLRNAAF